MDTAPAPETSAGRVPPFRVKQGPSRQIAFVGNCQAFALLNLYRRYVAPRTGDRLHAIASAEPLTDSGRRAIAEADLVVEQIFDAPLRADIATLMQAKPRILFPSVSAACLWPFAGVAHVRNEITPLLPSGPYDAELGDSFLNRMIEQAVPADEAAERYLALDISAVTDLDLRLEQDLSFQRLRDAQCGFSIAAMIEHFFRAEQLFLTPNHPNRRIAVALAGEVFRQLGATAEEADCMRRATAETPFPRTELPVHPSVARHFDLAWAPPDRLYRFRQEGSFTFRAHVDRYMRYAWNEALVEGLHLAGSGAPEPARARLADALAFGPNAAAHNALSIVLNRLGDKEAALQAARTATALAPEFAEYHVTLGNLHRRTGRFADALHALRTATALSPASAHAHLLLAILLRQMGQYAESCEAIDIAVQLHPYAPNYRAERAECLLAAGKTDAAIDTLAELAAADPDDAQTQYRLNQIRARNGKADSAIAALTAFLAASPAATRERILLSTILLDAGDQAKARAEAEQAVAHDPQSPLAHTQLGHVLLTIGTLPDAEAALRRALSLDDTVVQAWHELGIIAHRQSRIDVAIDAAHRAATLEPANAQRLLQLARFQQIAGKRAAAIQSLEAAIRLAPGHKAARARLEQLRAKTA